MATTKKTSKDLGVAKGYRSGLEDKIATQLESLEVPYQYEEVKIPYVKPETKHKYTPDFFITSTGIYVETKGRFLPEDRKKHLLIKEQHPELDIRFVFTSSKDTLGKRKRNPSWMTKAAIAKLKKTDPEKAEAAAQEPKYLSDSLTYAQWCEKHGFLYADKEIPKEWLH